MFPKELPFAPTTGIAAFILFTLTLVKGMWIPRTTTTTNIFSSITTTI